MANAKRHHIDLPGQELVQWWSPRWKGLDEKPLARIPADQCNSAAWILWHMSRVMDTFLHSRVLDTHQLWAKDGWAEGFGMAAELEDRGVGWNAAQVAAWSPPSRETQLGYYHAVKSAIQNYLEPGQRG